jgi:hypothetical protein
VVGSIPSCREFNYRRETRWKTLLSLTHCTVPWATGVSPILLKRIVFKKRLILHFEMLLVHKHSFHMLTPHSQENNVLDPPTSNIDSVLTWGRVLLPFTCWGHFAQRWYSSPLKTLRGKQCSFHMLTSSSEGNKVLDHLSSKLIVFLQQIQSFFHTLIRSYVAQTCYTHIWKPWDVVMLPLKNNLNSLRETLS